MKTLTLLRHAKSSWDDPVARDFDRPLNARGRKAARAIGREMRGAGPRLRPDPRLAGARGSSRRSTSWPRAMAARSPPAMTSASISPRPRPCSTLVRDGRRRGRAAAARRPQSGPGAARAAARPRRRRRCATQSRSNIRPATLAEIALPVEHWRDVARRHRARSTRFIRPRDLDPELGPDDGLDRSRSRRARRPARRRSARSCSAREGIVLVGRGRRCRGRRGRRRGRLAVAAAAGAAIAGRRGSYSRPG